MVSNALFPLKQLNWVLTKQIIHVMDFYFIFCRLSSIDYSTFIYKADGDEMKSIQISVQSHFLLLFFFSLWFMFECNIFTWRFSTFRPFISSFRLSLSLSASKSTSSKMIIDYYRISTLFILYGCRSAFFSILHT